MFRAPTSIERVILEGWRQSDDRRYSKLARRAACVLAPKIAEVDASAVGLSNQRMFEVRQAFAQMGLVGLVDAPRAGRPTAVSGDTLRSALVAQASAAAPPSLDQLAASLAVGKHTLWRVARQSGTDLQRRRWLEVIHPAVRTGINLSGVYLSAQLAVIATSDTLHTTVDRGIWHAPPNAAKLLALKNGALPVSMPAVLMSAALNAHAACQSPSKAQTEAEKLAFFCAALAGTSRPSETKLFVAGDMASAQAWTLLKGLRRHGLWQGLNGQLKACHFIEPRDWEVRFADSTGERLTLNKISSMCGFCWATLRHGLLN